MGGTKGLKRSASRVESEEEGAVLPQTTKKSKTTSATGNGVDKDGNAYWELSNKRRIGISKFKDMTMINIREYYEKDGDMLPGKKGISLSLTQYEALVKAIPQISAQLHAMGHGTEDSEDDGGAPTLLESVASVAKPKRSKTKKSKRSNFEATSDEDED